MLKQILKEYIGGWRIFIVRLLFVAIGMLTMHLWLNVNSKGWYILYLWCTIFIANFIDFLAAKLIVAAKAKYFTSKPTGHRAPAVNLAEKMQSYLDNAKN